MAYNEYWESDEFEDLVTRSLIAMYEKNVKKEKHAPRAIKFNEDVFKRYKNVGCYFTPHDRIVRFIQDENNRASFTQEIDIINDGLPERAVFTQKPFNENDTHYLHSFYMEKIPFLPKPFGSDIRGKYYRITQITFENKYVTGCSSVIVVDKNGKVQSCYSQGYDYDPITKRTKFVKIRPVNDNPDCNKIDYYCGWGSFTIQFYQDRRYLWNVQAYDGTAKATFGVYPEQIKSLFYARDLPNTETGRKRPILHWVQSHQRRMKSGTDVDIEKYLRGTHEFVMNDTKFRIVNPIKELKV